MNTTIQTRIDDKSKKQAERIFNQLGITLNDGIRLFVRQVIHQKALPFQPTLCDIPNKETIKAMKEVEAGNFSQSFHSLQELMDDLDA